MRPNRLSRRIPLLGIGQHMASRHGREQGRSFQKYALMSRTRTKSEAIELFRDSANDLPLCCSEDLYRNDWQGPVLNNHN